MKFTSLQHTGVKTLRVRDFKGGTNISDPAFNIADNTLSNSLNMQRKNGSLISRQGIYATEDNIISTNREADFRDVKFTVTDATFNVDGKERRVAFEYYDDFISGCSYTVFLLDENGNNLPAGMIYFSQTSSDTFFKPVNILFYSGKRVNGAGLFAIATVANIYDPSMIDYRIFELSSALSHWNRVISYYTPVVYINGRGTEYGRAKETGFAYTAEPKILESQNILSSRFVAYFTSDGYSSCFRLPFNNISNSTVICKVYISPTEYVRWCISKDETSDTQTFYTANITLNIDRATGMFYFTDAEGDYPVPMIGRYHENNIQISADKETDIDFKKAASCFSCACCDNKFIFFGGEDGSKIFVVDAENPLYFPLASCYTIGGGDKKTEAIVPAENKIIAFKENEIYELTLKKGEPINSVALLADNEAVFYKKDIVTARQISDKIGCKNKYSCINTGKRVLWLGNDKKIYSLDATNSNITPLSDAVSLYLEALDDGEILSGFAVEHNNNYILLMGKRAVIMNYKNNNSLSTSDVGWYFWDFGNVRMIGGASNGEELILFCNGSDKKVFYSAILSGEKDIDIVIDDDESPIITKHGFESSITTKSFDFGSILTKKLIESIFISVSATEDIEISLNGKYFDRVRLSLPDIDHACDTLKSVRLIPHLSGIETLNITLSSKKGFTLGELMFYYREMS